MLNIENFIADLNWRYATKSFDPSKKVAKETLDQVLEAARLSPSSYGLQPWNFFVIENLEIREILKTHARNQSQITDCSHLIVLASRSNIDAKYINDYADIVSKERNIASESIEGYRKMLLGSLPKMQGEAGLAWMTKQVYLALGVLLSACAQARIDSCPMEGFEASKFDEILDLSTKGFHARVLCPVGYRDPNDKMASLEKVRFEKSRIVHWVS